MQKKKNNVLAIFFMKNNWVNLENNDFLLAKTVFIFEREMFK
jgi:hypothetical protein